MDIKPCPVCNGTNVQTTYGAAGGQWVHCDDCYTAGPTCYSESGAIDGWNSLHNRKCRPTLALANTDKETMSRLQIATMLMQGCILQSLEFDDKHIELLFKFVDKLIEIERRTRK